MPFELAYTLCTPASCFATHFCNPCTKCMICSCIWCMLANMNPPTVCGVPDRDCLKRFQMQVSWFYLFTGISLGWFGFISSFFKYYRGKFGVISFVVSLYEQFYCTLWGSSSTSGLQIWYFNDFYIKSHHGGQELLHKNQRLLPLGFRIVYISISFVLF